MDDGVLRPLQTLDGAANEMFAGLRQHLYADVFGDAVFLDEPPGKVEFGLGSRGKAHLDLLEADLRQQVEQLELLLHVHGDGKGLVAVPQIHAAPYRGMIDRPAWPLAIRQVDGPPGTILCDRVFLHDVWVSYLKKN